MSIIFKVITNSPNDTDEITDTIADYIADMLIRQYDAGVVNLFNKELEDKCMKKY
ncbi:MAG: hypothetical protein E6248_13760 [Clostridium sp.]|uniref:hypothetical protein n=1 Tax=Clostridium sp. TaxID=1506 RepID=UPI00290D92DF|nr:hypothetical protein [Clostridium sp.]MDU5111507.1 hypothetical protein [Clostridium sp.]